MSRRVLVCLSVLMLSAALAPTCAEAQFMVARPGSGWPGAFPTISAAVTAAATAGGGEIWVQRGIYNETVAIPPTAGGIILLGGFHGWEIFPADRDYRNFRTNPTVIDGTGGGTSVVTFTMGCRAALDILDGFWIKNGGAFLGGGVQISAGSATVRNNTITECGANFGGGIGIQSTTGSVILNNTICSNRATTDGGGIYNEDAPSLIRGNRIGQTCCVGGGNMASGGSGGGIAVLRGDPQVFHNTVMFNYALQYGGGIYIHGCSSASIVGGNYVEGNYSNSAGGGILVEERDPILVNNTVYMNRVIAGWCGGVAFLNATTPRLLNNIISENWMFQVEANVFTAGIDIEDNTVWEPTLTWLYNLVPAPIRPRDVDPLLVLPCGGCIVVRHLAAISPCVDSGNGLWAAMYLMTQPFFDIDGEPRIGSTGMVDRGADEYWSPSIVLNVPSSYLTIQAALDQAGPGRTVAVAPGVYNENIVMKPCVTLDKGAGAGTVTIDGSGKNTVITVPIGVECTINNMAIRFGNAIQGGGVNVGMCASAFLDKCMIWDCFAEMDGGLFPNDPIGFGAGGGMYWALNSTGAVTYSKIFGNSAAPFNPWGIPSMTAMGGGVAMEMGASPTLSWCEIWSNRADWDGGGVWVCSNAARPLIELCRITGNMAQWGGGLYVRNTANPKVHNNLIAQNSATQSGGGIAVYGGGTGDYYSNTISDNIAPIAHQVDVFGGGPGMNVFINNIVSAPTTNPGIARGIPAFAPTVREFNCFWPDMIWAPDIIAPPNLNAKYQLKIGSPCIDSGNMLYAQTAVDLDNETRVRLPQIDIGADEFYLDLSSTPDLATGTEGLLLRMAGANPAHGSARIGYHLPSAGDVQLAVHDVLGRRVATLVDRRQEPGDYEAIWNGRRDDGREAPSGVYFLRLTAGTRETTGTLVLTR